jgi:hypothetical protein
MHGFYIDSRLYRRLQDAAGSADSSVSFEQHIKNQVNSEISNSVKNRLKIEKK